MRANSGKYGTFSMAERGVGLININIARHSKVGHFADQSLGQENVSGGQVPVDDLAEKNNIISTRKLFQSHFQSFKICHALAYLPAKAEKNLKFFSRWLDRV